MAVSPSFRDFVLEQLAGLGRLRARRMFGGVGIYSGESFFALIAADTLYLKVDDDSRADYLRRGMSPFRPYRDRPQWEMGYYAVPSDVLEDAEEMTAWARKALRAATAAPIRRRTPRTRPAGRRD